MWPSLGEIMSYEVLIATPRSVFHNVSQSFAAKHRKHVATTCSNNLQQKKSGSVCSNHYAVKWLRWCPIAYSLKTDRNVFCLIGGKLANRAILCCAACKSRRKRQTESEGNYRNYQFTRTSPRLVYTYRTDQADAHTHTQKKKCSIQIHVQYCTVQVMCFTVSPESAIWKPTSAIHGVILRKESSLWNDQSGSCHAYHSRSKRRSCIFGT